MTQIKDMPIRSSVPGGGYVMITEGAAGASTFAKVAPGALGTTGPAGPAGATGPAGPTGPTGPAPTSVPPSTLTLRNPLASTDNIVVYSVTDQAFRSGPAVFTAYTLAAGGSFTRPIAVTPVSLTWASTITIDATTGNNFRVVLGGATTFANPTGMVDGQLLNLRLKQDATGSRTVTWGSKFKWGGGTAPTLSTAANAVDRVSGIYVLVDDVIECTFRAGFA